MDKAHGGSTSRELNPLAQLHGALERETAGKLLDASVEVEFDASLAIYIGTANTLDALTAPILSRMQVFAIEPPSKWQAVDIATRIAEGALRRLGLESQLRFDRQALYLLSHMSPRHMARAAEQAIGAAVADGRAHVGEAELWSELGGADVDKLH